jgi:hypothetical protein
MTAPYRFIPISGWICEPTWGPSVSIDRPFEDGVSGWLDYTLTAKSHLLVGGEREEKNGVVHVHFYRTPDGVPTIPGASLRGMVRTILEIVAFGRAAFIDDTQYYEKKFVGGATQKLKHKDTTHDLLKRASDLHTRATVLDFPALLFGAETAKNANRKGRLSFEPAVGAVGLEEADEVQAVLASPKGQFFPIYVDQPVIIGDEYASYTPKASKKGRPFEVTHPELSGRKRYPSKVVLDGTRSGKDEVSTVLRPLKAGGIFSGRVRFHNLKPEELGALVWALELWAPSWGDRADLRHRLGMGKPLGLGDARIDLTGAWIEPNRVPRDGSRPSAIRDTSAARAYANAFDAHMKECFAAAKKPDKNVSWRTSEQIEMLLALCDPKCAKPDELKYMILDPDNVDRSKRRNQFAEAKKGKWRLPEAPRRPVMGETVSGTCQDRDVFPYLFPAQHAASAKGATGLADAGAGRDTIAVGTDWVTRERDEHVLVIGHPRRSAKVRVRYDDGALADLDPGDLRPPPEVDAR